MAVTRLDTKYVNNCVENVCTNCVYTLEFIKRLFKNKINNNNLYFNHFHFKVRNMSLMSKIISNISTGLSLNTTLGK